VIRACRTGRTVLITAANAGAIRLYAASHVIDEVAEHTERWARESGDLSPAAFRARWEDEYLPLVRVIEDERLSEELLGHEERARLHRLAEVDPDDVPSAILALALGAFFLSEDRRAVQAVYGDCADLGEHRNWLAMLRSGGNAGELGTMVFAAAMVPTLAVGGTIEAGRWVSRSLSPWALLPIGAGLVALAYRYVSKERWVGLGGGVGKLALGLMYLHANYLREYERFRAAAAPTPTWEELAGEVDRPSLLQRGCMHTLARSADGCLSASALAPSLPALGIGQGEALVRQALRGSGCFHQPYAGRWQVGHPAVRVATMIAD
jgi:predicted nucleic acid-binding protein